MSEGSLIVAARGGRGGDAGRAAPPAPAPAAAAEPAAAQPQRPPRRRRAGAGACPAERLPRRPAPSARRGPAHASPSVRRSRASWASTSRAVAGSGPAGRILQEDVQRFVKQALSGAAAHAGGAARGGGLDLLPWPQVDFARFGPVETRPLSRIKKISGANLRRNWVMIPHVTQLDEADITELEAFRGQLNEERRGREPR